MRRLLCFVCLFLAFSLFAGEALWQSLDNLTQYEKQNSLIYIEYVSGTNGETSLVEEKWNRGNYNEAIELLKNLPELDNALVCIQWKNPVKTSLRWGNDVRIGSREDIEGIALDVDHSTGHLFAALFHNTNPSYERYSVYFSSDTGKTWAETFSVAGTGFEVLDIDAVVHDKYFYVAYSANATGTHIGEIVRASTSNGSFDSGYLFQVAVNEGVDIRDIALVSDIDGVNYWLHYFAVMDNDSLRMYYSDTNAISWGTYHPNVGNADRGLDACCAALPASNLWASYIGTDDSLYVIGGYASWNYYGVIDYTGSSSYFKTSVSAYGDTVMIVYPYYNGGTDYSVRYSNTHNGGSSWSTVALYVSSSAASYVNDVTARGGDGLAVIYNTSGDSAQGIYRHRDYPAGGWTPAVSFADSAARANAKPSIERIASGLYGIAYVNYPEEIALFDRSDWVSGIEEKVITSDGKIGCSLDCSIITGTATLKYILPEKGSVDVSVVNLLGQTVTILDKGLKEAGEHITTISAENLSQGIYFIVVEADNGQKGTAKVTILK